MMKLIQIFSVYIIKELKETTTEQEQFWQIKDICYSNEKECSFNK